MDKAELIRFTVDKAELIRFTADKAELIRFTADKEEFNLLHCRRSRNKSLLNNYFSVAVTVV